MREFCIHDTGIVLKIPFILDRNLAKANCTENRVCTSCNTVVPAEDSLGVNGNASIGFNPGQVGDGPGEPSGVTGFTTEPVHEGRDSSAVRDAPNFLVKGSAWIPLLRKK